MLPVGTGRCRVQGKLIADISRAHSVLDVNPSVPANTVPEFIAYAKANPGKLNMGSGGSGTPGHVSGELFKTMASIDMLHVPYRGARSRIDLRRTSSPPVTTGHPLRACGEGHA